MNVELVHRTLPVLFNRVESDAEGDTDLLVRLSFRHEFEHLRLASRQADTIGRSQAVAVV